jgi:hypothetical protein
VGSSDSVLSFSRIAAIRKILHAIVEAASDAERQGWLGRMIDYGRRLT